MRVLVADDDSDVVLLFRLKFEGRGHEVLEVADGAEAISVAEAERPDVLILDVMMPGCDGFAVLEALSTKGLVPGLPVIMVSARVAAEDQERALRAGAFSYVTKPFDPDHVVALVEDVASGRDRQQGRQQAMTGRRNPAAEPRQADSELPDASPTLQPSFTDADSRLAGILELAVDAIVSVDEEQRIVGFNKGAEGLFGYVAEEMIGKPLDVLLPRWAVDEHREHVRGFAASSEVARPMGMRRAVFGRRRNGEEFPAEASIIKLDVAGKPTFTAILRDASERYRAEEELRARARQQEAVASLGQRALGGLRLDVLMDEVVQALREVLDVDYAAVLELDAEAHQLVMCAGAGWRAGVVGNATFDADRGAHAGYALLSQAPTTIEDLRTETRFTGAPVLHEHGVVSAMTTTIHGPHSPFGTLGVYTSSGRRFGSDQLHFLQSMANVLAAAIERQRTEVQLRNLLDAAPDATLLVDTDGRIVSANAQVGPLFGYTPQELVGVGVEVLVPEHVRTVHAAHRAGYAAEPRTRPMGVGLPLAARRKDGTEVPVDIMLSPLHTDQRPLVVAAVRDVTERRRSEAIRDAFLHAVSHELRTPLTTVLGFASMLANDDVPAEGVRELAKRVHENAACLDRLLSDLLDLDRLSRGVIEPRRRPTDVVALVEGVLASLAHQDHPVEVDVQPDPFVVDIDPAHVERTVENLLANVFKHTPPGTRAWVRARRGPNGLLVMVEDDGPGIPDELRGSIFEPFQRGSTSSHAPGTGIGLSLVSRFAELHGGRAWVEDRDDGGSSFRVLFASPPPDRAPWSSPG